MRIQLRPGIGWRKKTDATSVAGQRFCIGVSGGILSGAEIGALPRTGAAGLSYEVLEASGGREPLKLPAYIAATCERRPIWSFEYILAR